MSFIMEFVNKGVSDLMKLPKLLPKDFGGSSKEPCILVLCKDVEDLKRLNELIDWPFENVLIFGTRPENFESNTPFVLFKSKNVSYESKEFKESLQLVKENCQDKMFGGSLFFTPVWVIEEE